MLVTKKERMERLIASIDDILHIKQRLLRFRLPVGGIELCRTFHDSLVKHIGIQSAVVVALIDGLVIIRGA